MIQEGSGPGPVSLVSLLANPRQETPRSVITTYDYGSYSVRNGQWHYVRYIDDSEELYDLVDDPEEWTKLASDPRFARTKGELAASIPEDAVDLPEESLLELQEQAAAIRTPVVLAGAYAPRLVVGGEGLENGTELLVAGIGHRPRNFF